MAGTDTIYEARPPPHIPVDPAVLPPQLTLTEAQQKLYDEVLKHFEKDDYVLPGVENGALTEQEKFWLVCRGYSDASWVILRVPSTVREYAQDRLRFLSCIGNQYECSYHARFLRAVKWASAQAATKRLEETLKWRREYGLYELITASYVEPEALTGKMMIWGYDSDKRPAIYLRPSKQNTEESIRQVHYVVWALERLTELMGPGIETLALMVDFADRAKNPSLGQARTVLNILQTHCTASLHQLSPAPLTLLSPTDPERLGRALVVNVPFLVNAFFKLITPFIDPLTRPKLRFNPNCLAEGLFPPDELIAEWGGSAHVVHEHERYWDPLVRMCAERRERLWEKWREAGAKVGVREWDVKCALELEGAKLDASVPVAPEVATEEVAAPVLAKVVEEAEVAKEPEVVAPTAATAV
ncbi:CRAL-TRIO domain-containing protein C23B6.04c [Trametes pubescens]|uniref:CRAL-TRIO domain-containing protein C23B6.04c n=1 Tax=Trametes pubescens TaxID=154538 RepID=A0A1M2W579_TRAPU|nr:CRAL-TRIO domain-containing protein C23B6.04c [Trametes pubescens]